MTVNAKKKRQSMMSNKHLSEEYLYLYENHVFVMINGQMK